MKREMIRPRAKEERKKERRKRKRKNLRRRHKISKQLLGKKKMLLRMLSEVKAEIMMKHLI